MANVSYEVNDCIRLIGEITRELEALGQEIPKAMQGIDTSKIVKELQQSAQSYKNVRSVLYRID